MVIILTALLAGSKVLPMIDRDALDLQARAEALQPRTHAQRAPRRAGRQPRRASGGNPLDLAQITTICRAAGEQADPAAFIGRLSTAYSLSVRRQRLAALQLRRLSGRPGRRAPRRWRQHLLRDPALSDYSKSGACA